MNIDIKDILIDAEYLIYPQSINWVNNGLVCMARYHDDDVIISDVKAGFSGDIIKLNEQRYIRGELNHENAEVLRSHFAFSAPSCVLNNNSTIGLGDRLGVATPGHIKAINKFRNILPVFAQQSMRELKLTHRSYSEVLDCASFSVFREGYKRGFGADGDHLKTLDEINLAISCGYTMITLDCSDYIRNDIYFLSDEQIEENYTSDNDLEQRYLDKIIRIGNGIELVYSIDQLRKIELIYRGVITHSSKIFKSIFGKKGVSVDFELSVDETSEPTTPLEHYFIANELIRQGVNFASLAPHFQGEFQKGIDYIGDLKKFTEDLVFHVAIAKHFNYKLSIHSGSDKFSVFPIIGELTRGAYHVKTSGTSWLEAIRLVAEKDPTLYREIHQFAIVKFKQAQQNYHVGADISSIPIIDNLSDEQLPELLSINDARQLLHITYGFILQEKDKNGKYLYRYRLFRVLKVYHAEYSEFLDNHITKHLSYLEHGK